MKTMRIFAGMLAVCLAMSGVRAGDWVSDPGSQMVFHAVLEGLYADGVSNEDVDRILPREHFVYACPLCEPAYAAFAAYRARPEFQNRKAPISTFGKGLDPAISEKLKSKEVSTRRWTIGALIQGWVQKRLESMRLTPEESAEWNGRLGALHKQGMAMKDKFHDQYQEKDCAICSGCSNAGEKVCKLAPVMSLKSAKTNPAVAVPPPKVTDEQF
ncbi:MAG TPA: hypothetical protein VKX17_10375 [Planctomycetota bacterium]|nr:hypothetical protein [Planctomycetota bacterium]